MYLQKKKKKKKPFNLRNQMSA